ncbi:MAG: ImmA/IrrE family metallo-endopeptidase, partial [Nocardioides sp.]
ATETTGTIGARVRASIPLHLSQRRLAPEVGMTHDALSRAINGQRHFSALELARLAERLRVDTHWLITGEQDPFQIRLAARHPWGQSSAKHEERDGAIIARVVDAYRAAYDTVGRVPTERTALPADPGTLRAMLPRESVRFLAEQVQDVLGIDIVRDPGLQTDYSFRVGDHAVVVLKSTISWFRANWSIAHELGHLALGHHVNDKTSPAEEGPADAFASQFLLPENMVRSVNWKTLSVADLAVWLWSAGVSTAALTQRLRDLGISPSEQIHDALAETTPKLMRAHVGLLRQAMQEHGDPIWARENATTGRRFPAHVVVALTEQVEVGNADPYLLAWVREVPVDELTWPEPDVDNLPSRLEEVSAETDDTTWFDLLEAR